MQSQDNQEIIPGETMFQYLKRKKRTMLQQSLNRAKPRLQENKREVLAERAPNYKNEDYEETKRQKLKDSFFRLLKEKKEIESSSVTPKRVTFVQEQRRDASRSFLQMISPIRSKSPVLRELEKSVKAESFGGKKESYKQNYTKKMLREKINNLRDLIEGFIKTGKNLKDKSHFLFVDMKPIFRHVQRCQDSGIQKKTEQIKAKLRAFENLFKEFDIENSEETIDACYKHFSQHLNELEGFNRAQIEQNKNSIVNQLTNNKNRQTNQLREQKRSLEKELTAIHKKYEKLQNNYQKLLESSEESSQSLINNHRQKVQFVQSQVQTLNDQLKIKNEQIQVLKLKVSKQEGQIKNIIIQRQKYNQQCLNTIMRVRSQQEQYLLNEIMILKKEFSNDITQMAQFQRLKEQEYIPRLKEGQIQTQKLRQKVSQLIEANLRMEENMNVTKSSVNRFRKQNECLATDMHRINQQLYQHWLALKDIKTLSLRLDIFNKFKKIYTELAFNEHLFM